MTYRDEGEHPCEQLVRVIQSKDGRYSAEQREEAFEQLLTMFRRMIYDISIRVFNFYRRTIPLSEKDFIADAYFIFTEMILDDYVPKKEGGAAMFAPYAKKKLSLRILDHAQNFTKKYNREIASENLSTLMDQSGIDKNKHKNLLKVYQGHNELCSFEYVVERLINKISISSSKDAFEVQQNNDLLEKLCVVTNLASTYLDEKEFLIWYQSLFCEASLSTIADMLNEQFPGEGKWTKQKVHNIIAFVKLKVLAEYGKLCLKGEFFED